MSSRSRQTLPALLLGLLIATAGCGGAASLGGAEGERLDGALNLTFQTYPNGTSWSGGPVRAVADFRSGLWYPAWGLQIQGQPLVYELRGRRLRLIMAGDFGFMAGLNSQDRQAKTTILVEGEFARREGDRVYGPFTGLVSCSEDRRAFRPGSGAWEESHIEHWNGTVEAVCRLDGSSVDGLTVLPAGPR